MFSNLRKLVKSALTDYERREREEWVLCHASQIVLTVAQMVWCRSIMEILEADFDRVEAMKDFEQQNFRDLNKLAALVRGELGKLDRAVLCALITIDVHGRDMVTEMVHNKVKLTFRESFSVYENETSLDTLVEFSRRYPSLVDHLSKHRGLFLTCFPGGFCRQL